MPVKRRSCHCISRKRPWKIPRGFLRWLEAHCLPTTGGLGVAGDSLRDKQINEAYNNVESWLELLVIQRSNVVTLLHYKEPRRKSYNYVRAGAASVTLLRAGEI